MISNYRHTDFLEFGTLISNNRSGDGFGAGILKMNLTQDQLSEMTGINRLMIGRIERMNFVPSIAQMEILADKLHFDITELFYEKEQSNSFVALRSEALNESEKAGVDMLFEMMLTLRQQVVLRSKSDDESTDRA